MVSGRDGTKKGRGSLNIGEHAFRRSCPGSSMYVRREPAIFPFSNLSTEERRSTAHGSWSSALRRASTEWRRRQCVRTAAPTAPRPGGSRRLRRCCGWAVRTRHVLGNRPRHRHVRRRQGAARAGGGRWSPRRPSGSTAASSEPCCAARRSSSSSRASSCSSRGVSASNTGQEGSTVRVRQRAFRKALQMGMLCCLNKEHADTKRTHLRFARRIATSRGAY
jgi:hypothetical protein